jgi:deoxyadenosine/deoxycytidine kinase
LLTVTAAKEELMEQDLFRSFTVADYYFMKSLVFSSTTLDPRMSSAFTARFSTSSTTSSRNLTSMSNLHVLPDRLLRNIAIRGREYEKSITSEYLAGIQEAISTFSGEPRKPLPGA